MCISAMPKSDIPEHLTCPLNRCTYGEVGVSGAD